MFARVIRALAACFTCALALTGIIILFPTLAQTGSALSGVVVTGDGRPLSGVLVYGGIWKECCPYQQDKVTTDERGKFFLEHPGAVAHFSGENLQPLTLVVKPGVTQTRIVMTEAETPVTVRPCLKPERNQKQVGWGKNGVHFTVPKDGLKILGGKPDVDYVRYVIRPKKGSSFLTLWFGGNSISLQPDDQQFVESVDFSQRHLSSSGGGVIGIDSSGRLSSGLSWRHTAVLGSGGAVYQNADKEAAALFDQIINSICTADYSQK